jgi:hypothetical protein
MLKKYLAFPSCGVCVHDAELHAIGHTTVAIVFVDNNDSLFCYNLLHFLFLLGNEILERLFFRRENNRDALLSSSDIWDISELLFIS